MLRSLRSWAGGRRAGGRNSASEGEVTKLKSRPARVCDRPHNDRSQRPGYGGTLGSNALYAFPPIERLMATSKKSAKRSAARRKKAAGKASAKRGAAKSTAKAKRSKRRSGLKTVRQVGKKTWKTLKSTTAQVVEGVKETFGS